MKKILSIIAILSLVFTFTFAHPAFAADLTNGAKVFTGNCNACHLGGKNVVNAAKTLKKSDLEKYKMNTADAIIAQVTKGKAAMPAFKGRLTDTQIEDVAAYVLAQAEKDWAK
ncbi:cytochrome c6 PetJ [Floridanema evergladense]|uniref:Cytochrome c6 n=1 Tax=Floridaenema evergladense BLCC-F167 TaxID=3153639 RepID=A0ABV4WMR3_9CYAN